MDECIIICRPAAEPDSLDGYGDVPISFWVRSRIVVPVDGHVPPGAPLVEEAVDQPYFKDYDAIAGEGPTEWGRWLDISEWAVLRAYVGAEYAGAAVVAWKSSGAIVLEDREDLAVLWDIRVHPDYRGRGVGHRLFAEAEDWAREHGCRELKVETQNINAPACRFYAREGCELREINYGVFDDAPDEIQFYWYKDLT